GDDAPHDRGAGVGTTGLRAQCRGPPQRGRTQLEPAPRYTRFAVSLLSPVTPVTFSISKRNESTRVVSGRTIPPTRCQWRTTKTSNWTEKQRPPQTRREMSQ